MEHTRTRTLVLGMLLGALFMAILNAVANGVPAAAQERQSWEQRCTVVSAGHGFNHPPNDQLASMGRDGWELVSSSLGANEDGWRGMFCFKRPR